jgi:hypothetical protein
MRKLVLALVLLGLVGCAPVGMRKITAWGIWAMPMGMPVGIGYWHSEHGKGVESEDSAKPELPK